jgi:hypothetical protein
MSVGFMLESEDTAVIWRGPKKNGLIKQFLRDVEWGTLDYLIVDTPPGTSDEHLSIAQYLSSSVKKEKRKKKKMKKSVLFVCWFLFLVDCGFIQVFNVFCKPAFIRVVVRNYFFFGELFGEAWFKLFVFSSLREPQTASTRSIFVSKLLIFEFDFMFVAFARKRNQTVGLRHPKVVCVFSRCRNRKRPWNGRFPKDFDFDLDLRPEFAIFFFFTHFFFVFLLV